jgi:hypothetical protein
MAMHVNDWAAVQDRVVSVPEHVVFREMSDETIVLNVSTGKYHSLDPVATRFFEVLRQSANISAARDELADQYQQPRERIETDLAEFCETLARLGLIEVGEREAA